MKAFNFAKVPPIYFGASKLRLLPELIAKFNSKGVLLVTGGKSLQVSGKLSGIQDLLEKAGIDYYQVRCDREPTTLWIDDICAKKRGLPIDGVVAIGGGSAIDAGKAIAAMLPHHHSIVNHLEGVGRSLLPHSGIGKKFIAVPTTSGTGSEVTPTAAIFEAGYRVRKKYFYHENLLADAVIVDAELVLSCSPEITATCGMTAFTQLLESYISPTASPLTEAIAWSGLEAIKDNLLLARASGRHNINIREKIAYASLISGIVRPNSNWGIVQKIASIICGYFSIPYRIVCSTLTASSIRMTLKALQSRFPESPTIEKMAAVGKLLDGRSNQSAEYYCDALVNSLDAWTQILELPRLGQYGIQKKELDKLLSKPFNYPNLIQLNRGEIQAILEERL